MIGAGVLTLALGLSACGSNPSPEPSETQSQEPVANVTAPILDTLQGAERDRVAQLIAGAEGELDWVDSVVAPSTATAMAAEFKTLYNLPNLKLNHERLGSGDIAARVTEEVQSGRVSTDLIGVASHRFWVSLRDAGALAKYESPETANYSSEAALMLDHDAGYWFSPVTYTFNPITSPPKYSKPINSWQDLLDPALAGKFSVPNSGTAEASLYWYIGLRDVLGADFFKSLAANKATISTGSSTLETQRVASGELLLGLTAGFRTFQTSAETGVEMAAWWPEEGIPMLGQSYGILEQAVHPNVTRLFYDYLLSEAGQTQYVGAEGITSARDNLAVPEEVAKYSPPLSEIKTIPFNYDAPAAELDAARAEWKQIFGQ